MYCKVTFSAVGGVHGPSLSVEETRETPPAAFLDFGTKRRGAASHREMGHKAINATTLRSC